MIPALPNACTIGVPPAQVLPCVSVSKHEFQTLVPGDSMLVYVAMVARGRVPRSCARASGRARAVKETCVRRCPSLVCIEPLEWYRQHVSAYVQKRIYTYAHARMKHDFILNPGVSFWAQTGAQKHRPLILCLISFAFRCFGMLRCGTCACGRALVVLRACILHLLSMIQILSGNSSHDRCRH